MSIYKSGTSSGIYKSSGSKSLFNDPAQILEALGYKKKEPKANVLERLGSLFSFTETAPLVYKTLESGGNVLAGLGEYGKNVAQGLETAFTGKKQKESKKTYKDVLTGFAGMKDENKGPLGIDLVDVLGTGLDIGLDPQSWTGIGVAGKLTKAGEKASKTAFKEALEKGATREAAVLSGKRALAELGSKGVQKGGALTFAGREIADLNKLGKFATPVKAWIDPFSQAIAPAARNIKKLFSTGTTAPELLAKSLTREMSNYAPTMGTMVKNRFKNLAKGLTDNDITQIVTKVELEKTGEHEAIKLGSQAQKVYDELLPISKQISAQYGDQGFGTVGDINYVLRIGLGESPEKAIKKVNNFAGSYVVPRNLKTKSREVVKFTPDVIDQAPVIGTAEQLGMRPAEELIDYTTRNLENINKAVGGNIDRLGRKSARAAQLIADNQFQVPLKTLKDEIKRSSTGMVSTWANAMGVPVADFVVTDQFINKSVSDIAQKMKFMGASEDTVARYLKEAAQKPFKGGLEEVQNWSDKFISKEYQRVNQAQRFIDTANESIDRYRKLQEARVAPLKEMQTKLQGVDTFTGTLAEPTLFTVGSATAQELADAGYKYSTDIGELAGTMVEKQLKRDAATKFYTEFAKFGTDKAEEGLVKFSDIIPESKAGNLGDVYKVIKDKYFAPDEVEVLNRVYKSFVNPEEVKGLLKAIDSATNLFKKYVTVPFPSFHVRNFISNMFNSFIGGGATVEDMGRGFKFYKEYVIPRLGGKTAEELTQKSLYGMKSEQLFQDMLKQGIIGAGFQQAEEAITPAGELLGKIKNAPVVKQVLGAEKKVFEGAGVVGRTVEDASKTGLFFSKLGKGSTVEEAADNVRKWLFDYTDKTVFEKNIAQRAIPFYTWMRKNLELQLTEMLHNPGRYSAIFKTARGMQKSGNISEEDYAALPDWMKQGFGFALGKKGDDVNFITGLGLPVEALGNLSGKQLLSSMNPIARIFFEKSTGQNIFKGTKLSQDTSAYAYRNLPKALKDMLQIREIKSADGKIRYVMPADIKYTLSNLPGFGRGMSFAGNLSNVGTGETGSLLPMFTGVGSYKRDIEQEKKYREQELQDMLWEQLQALGMANSYARMYAPKDMKYSFESLRKK